MYNDLRLITNFIVRPTRIERLMADKISLGHRIIHIRLALENR